MSKLGITRIMLWVMAALVAVVMGFGASEAQAHSDHEHGHHATAVSSPLIPTQIEGLVGREAVHAAKLQPHAAYVVFAGEGAFPNSSHGPSDACNCCTGSSCCSVVCLTAISHQVVPPPVLTATLRLPSGLSPVGIDPSALLRPPRPFA
jgi:hypothetical protein